MPPTKPRTNIYLLITLAAVVVGAVVMVIVLTNDQPTSTGNVDTTTNESALPPLTATWSHFTDSKYGVRFAVPRGMTLCLRKPDGAIMRNDTCDASTPPTFTVRSDAAWQALDALPAFAAAYGQELREAGIADPNGRVAVRTVGESTIAELDLSDALHGAIVSVVRTDGTRTTVAVDVQRKVPPVVYGSTTTFEEVTKAILENFAAANRSPL